ncbi:MAG: copper-binding protein, partial [Tateyamaria sp.]
MPDLWGVATVATKFALYLGVLVSAGTVFVSLIFQIAHIRRVSVAFAALGLVAALLGFSIGGAALTGDAGGMIDLEMLGLLWTTPVGTALAFRVSGLALLIAGLMLGRVGIWIAALGGILALWSFATIGHVPAKDTPWLSALLLIHLIVAAFWIGILGPLQRLALQGTAEATAD